MTMATLRTIAKNGFIFYQRNSQLSRSVECADSSKTCRDLIQFQMEVRKICSHSSDHAELGHFTVLVLQRTTKKFTKSNY